jgi:hypothetical protein
VGHLGSVPRHRHRLVRADRRQRVRPRLLPQQPRLGEQPGYAGVGRLLPLPEPPRPAASGRDEEQPRRCQPDDLPPGTALDRRFGIRHLPRPRFLLGPRLRRRPLALGRPQPLLHAGLVVGQRLGHPTRIPRPILPSGR